MCALQPCPHPSVPSRGGCSSHTWAPWGRVPISSSGPSCPLGRSPGAGRPAYTYLNCRGQLPGTGGLPQLPLCSSRAPPWGLYCEPSGNQGSPRPPAQAQRRIYRDDAHERHLVWEKEAAARSLRPAGRPLGRFLRQGRRNERRRRGECGAAVFNVTSGKFQGVRGDFLLHKIGSLKQVTSIFSKGWAAWRWWQLWLEHRPGLCNVGAMRGPGARDRHPLWSLSQGQEPQGPRASGPPCILGPRGRAEAPAGSTVCGSWRGGWQATPTDMSHRASQPAPGPLPALSCLLRREKELFPSPRQLKTKTNQSPP